MIDWFDWLIDLKDTIMQISNFKIVNFDKNLNKILHKV